MADERELTTVFRSADADAEEQAGAVRDLLIQEGLQAKVCDDSCPGVPDGAFEVRVPPGEQSAAERLIAEQDFSVDLSDDLDMVPVFISETADAEMVAAQIRSLLDAQEIPSVVMGASMFPNLPIEVKVPKARLEDARQAIAAAVEAGAAAAEEAEQETESQSGV